MPRRRGAVSVVCPAGCRRRALSGCTRGRVLDNADDGHGSRSAAPPIPVSRTTGILLPVGQRKRVGYGPRVLKRLQAFNPFKIGSPTCPFWTPFRIAPGHCEPGGVLCKGTLSLVAGPEILRVRQRRIDKTSNLKLVARKRAWPAIPDKDRCNADWTAALCDDGRR